jgi:hypothetical protein
MGALTATTAIRHLAADAWSLSRLWATVLGILAALTFGFVVGRIWQIRCDELERARRVRLTTRRAHSPANKR